MMTGKRVKLRGVLVQTASSAAIGEDGSLVIELYDFSDAAQKWLGNDVAFLLKLDAGAKGDALARLLPDGPPLTADDDALLLQLVAERFADYYDVEQWLNEQGIPFRKEFEPWA